MNKIEALLKKGTVNVQGHTYDIEVIDERVDLIPIGSGAVAQSSMSGEAYEYTHGGDTYRKAVEAAWEIAEYLTEKRKEGADY